MTRANMRARPRERQQTMTIYDGHIKRAVGSIKTAIGLGGSSADTLETVFEHGSACSTSRTPGRWPTEPANGQDAPPRKYSPQSLYRHPKFLCLKNARRWIHRGICQPDL